MEEAPRSQALALLIGTVSLSWVAIINGSPLFFADSGTYIRTAMELYFSVDRPVTYGLLIAPLLRTAGPWAVVAVQAAVTAWLVMLVARRVVGRTNLASISCLIVLAGLTSLPWFVGQIMPDLFAGLLPLLVFLIIMPPRPGLLFPGLLFPGLLLALLAAMLAMHFSLVPVGLAIIVSGTAAACPFLPWRVALGRGGCALVAVAIAVLGLSAVNLVVVHRFAPSVSSNMFLAARLLDTRIGQITLAEACGQETMKLCDERPFLEDPKRDQPGQEWLWHADAPRGRLAAADPARLEKEEGELVRLAIRGHLDFVIASALHGWAEQLTRFRTGDGLIAYGNETQIDQQLRRHFPIAAGWWDGSRQKRGTLLEHVVPAIPWLVLLGAAASPIILVLAFRRQDGPLFMLTVIVMVTVVVNAAVCGALSGPADRYEARVAWLLPFLAMISIPRLSRPARADPGPANSAAFEQSAASRGGGDERVRTLPGRP